MAERERLFMHAPRADSEQAVIMALTAYRLFASPVHAVYVDERCALGQMIHGPATTLAGRLDYDEVVMHPQTAAEHARPFLGPVIPYLKEVSAMADDIETKRFARQRVEWWIPAGTYNGDGARVEDIGLATAWAQQELEKRGVVKQRGQAPLTAFDFEGHIRIKPHDEHVIVYIEFDEEQKK